MFIRQRPVLQNITAAILCAALLLGTPFVPPAYAPNPAWWSDPATRILNNAPGVTPDNFAVANLGQLKHVATMAKTYLDQQLSTVGGAGPVIEALVASFIPVGGHTTDSRAGNYAPINLGQLKAVAKPFYDRLISLGINTRESLIAHGYPSISNGAAADWAYAYPWNPNDPWNSPSPNGQQVDKSINLAPVNIGQLKIVFSFDAN